MYSPTSRRSVLAAVGSLVMAGCLSDTDDVGNTAVEQVIIGATPPADEPNNAPPVADRELPIPGDLETLANAVQDGGPGKDGIPAIDDPTFIPPAEADFLNDRTVILGVVGDSEVKAYRRGVLVHHEIINDTLDGVPVSVTYCPLTGTALGFERGETEFGVSGQLLNNNLIMYDREIERWWAQIPAVSIPGPWSSSAGGAVLQEFNVIRTRWEDWYREYPETVVLAEDTGFARDYDFDPYSFEGYYHSSSTPYANMHTDDRFHTKDWVYGIRTASGAACFYKESLSEAGVMQANLDGDEYLAVYDQRLDTAHTYQNPAQRQFTQENGAYTADNGESFAPDELPLDPVPSFDAFWFAWVAYYPNTQIHE